MESRFIAGALFFWVAAVRPDLFQQASLVSYPSWLNRFLIIRLSDTQAFRSTQRTQEIQVISRDDRFQNIPDDGRRDRGQRKHLHLQRFRLNDYSNNPHVKREPMKFSWETALPSGRRLRSRRREKRQSEGQRIPNPCFALNEVCAEEYLPIRAEI